MLGQLLGSALALAEALITEENCRKEVLGVVGTLVADDVAGPPDRPGGRELLEPGLVVAAARPGDGLGDALAQAPQHEVARDRETTVEVHRGDDRFEGVGEDRLLGAPARRVLALAQEQVRAEIDLLRDLREHPRVHDAGADLRELPFGEIGEVLEHVVRHDEPEHGVAEELEPFVRRRSFVLRAPRPVRERTEQQRTVVEVHTERRFELVETRARRGIGGAFQSTARSKCRSRRSFSAPASQARPRRRTRPRRPPSAIRRDLRRRS